MSPDLNNLSAMARQCNALSIAIEHYSDADLDERPAAWNHLIETAKKLQTTIEKGLHYA